MSNVLPSEIATMLDQIMHSVILTHPLITRNEQAVPSISMDQLATVLRESLIHEILTRYQQVKENDSNARVIDALNDPDFRRYLIDVSNHVISEYLEPRNQGVA